MKKEDITQLIISGAKSVAASVPIAASFSQALSEVESRLNKKRLESLILKIYERLSALEESALNKEFLQSEEFFDIFRACVEASFRTASDDKRNYIARFLGGVIERGNINVLSLQIAADINNLQDFHLHILDYLPTEARSLLMLKALRVCHGKFIIKEMMI